MSDTMSRLAQSAARVPETLWCGSACCSLGWVVVAASDVGVCLIEFADTGPRAPDRVRTRFVGVQAEVGGSEFAPTLQGVVDLVESPATPVDLPLDMRGTDFQRQVWRALCGIRAGCTVSYAELAVRIGRPTAARAVARACGANPLAVAVPCHRVIRSNGALGGYRWSLARKAELLRREGVVCRA